jgi:hypothetical protein
MNELRGGNYSVVEIERKDGRRGFSGEMKIMRGDGGDGMMFVGK